MFQNMFVHNDYIWSLIKNFRQYLYLPNIYATRSPIRGQLLRCTMNDNIIKIILPIYFSTHNIPFPLLNALDLSHSFSLIRKRYPNDDNDLEYKSNTYRYKPERNIQFIFINQPDGEIELNRLQYKMCKRSYRKYVRRVYILEFIIGIQ